LPHPRYGTIFPHPLQEGDPVLLFAPSSPVKKPYLEYAIKLLNDLHLKVVEGRSLREPPSPFSAGSSKIRLKDIQDGIKKKVRAILPARGGYGAVDLLPHFPFRKIAQLSPLIIGGSDFTYLSVPLLQKGNLVHFYGPMPGGGMAKGDKKGEEEYKKVLLGNYTSFFPVTDERQILKGGSQEGEIRGGCLSILASLCGTPFAPDFRGAIALIEDQGEHPYRVDRLLKQLYQSGVLRGVKGIWFGLFPNTPDPDPGGSRLPLVLKNFAEALRVPALWGFPLGHGAGAIPVPVGVKGHLSKEGVRILESPFSKM